jgi:hypothetical protein
MAVVQRRIAGQDFEGRRAFDPWSGSGGEGNLRVLIEGSRGRECPQAEGGCKGESRTSPLCSMGPWGERILPGRDPTARRWPWGFRGSLEAPLNGDATAGCCTAPNRGSIPRRCRSSPWRTDAHTRIWTVRACPGGCNGGREVAPLPRWCGTTTHILRLLRTTLFTIRLRVSPQPKARPLDALQQGSGHGSTGL